MFLLSILKNFYLESWNVSHLQEFVMTYVMYWGLRVLQPWGLGYCYTSKQGFNNINLLKVSILNYNLNTIFLHSLNIKFVGCDNNIFSPNKIHNPLGPQEFHVKVMKPHSTCLVTRIKEVSKLEKWRAHGSGDQARGLMEQ